MALASHGPIQIGRYRSRSVSLRITTCRLDSMWTRTLSTTISTSPSSAMADYPMPAGAGGRPGPEAAGHEEPCDEGPGHEPADVGEERDAARVALDHAERGQPVDELEDEPEPEHDDRRDVDELVEEARGRRAR